MAATGSGTILDSSGNGFDGTPVNGPTYSSSVAVNPIPQTGAGNNLSMAFNGTDQRIFIPDNPAFELTQSLTIEAYVDCFSAANANSQILFRGDDRGGLDPYYLDIQSTIFGPYVVFSVEDAANDQAAVVAPLPSLDSWHFLAATLDDSTGAMSLYIDGVLADSTTTSIRPFGALDPTQNPGLGIGNVQSSNYGEYFDGLIDEVRLSDQALAPSAFLDAAPTPEPSTIAILGAGAIGPVIYVLRRRRQRRRFLRETGSVGKLGQNCL